MKIFEDESEHHRYLFIVQKSSHLSYVTFSRSQTSINQMRIQGQGSQGLENKQETAVVSEVSHYKMIILLSGTREYAQNDRGISMRSGKRSVSV